MSGCVWARRVARPQCAKAVGGNPCSKRTATGLRGDNELPGGGGSQQVAQSALAQVRAPYTRPPKRDMR
eukprot:scaffold17151_cov81-Phaeocystis_antarctica.AAC.5